MGEALEVYKREIGRLEAKAAESALYETNLEKRLAISEAREAAAHSRLGLLETQLGELADLNADVSKQLADAVRTNRVVRKETVPTRVKGALAKERRGDDCEAKVRLLESQVAESSAQAEDATDAAREAEAIQNDLRADRDACVMRAAAVMDELKDTQDELHAAKLYVGAGGADDGTGGEPVARLLERAHSRAGAPAGGFLDMTRPANMA